MSHERKCLMCGKSYRYCSHCNDFDPTETWKYLYHDKKCMDIANIWYAYRGKEISQEKAKQKMSELKPNIDDVLKYTSLAAKEIREIFDTKEEGLEQIDIVEEVPVVEEKVEEKVETQKPVNDVKYNNYHKYNKNHKA